MMDFTFIPIICLWLAGGKAAAGEECEGKPAEIAFVLDISSSIYPEDHDKQLDFVREVVDIFHIGPDKMRVAAVAFSDGVHPQFDLNSYTDKDGLRDAVTKIPYLGGSTQTDRALKYLRKAGGKAAAGEECEGKPAEIAFVLDISSSIYPEDHDNQLDFVREVVDIFHIGPDKMRVAAVAFSDDVHPQFDLNSYTDKDGLRDAVTKIPYLGGSTQTDRALKYLRKVVLSRDTVRPGVPRVGIVLTDGMSNDGAATREEALLAREEGIILFVVGIGFGVDEGELRSIGSSPKDNFVLKIDDFSALDSIKNKLAIKACKAEEQLETVDASDEEQAVIDEACGGKPADVVFALDTSSSIYMDDYNKQLQFVKDVVNMFDVGEDKTRVGLFTFSDDSYPQFSLTSYDSKEKLEEAIMGIAYTGGSTYTDKALEFMRSVAFQPSEERPDAVRIGIILTDGMSHDTTETLKQAGLTKTRASLFVIGIGPEVDTQELDGIASSPVTEHRFTTDSFDALQHIKKALAIKACAVDVKPEIQKEQQYTQDCYHLGPVDLAFGVDSARLGEENTESLLNFINNLVQVFRVGPKAFRLSVVTTSCSHGKDISFSKHFSKAGFQHELLDFGRADYTALVKKLRLVGFSGENGARNSSRKIALFFMLGAPKDDRRLQREMMRATFKGIHFYAIGIGPQIDKRTLIRLFGKKFDKYFIQTDSIVELMAIRNHVIEMLCPP